MENDNTEKDKLAVQTRLDPNLYSAISNLAVQEDRSISKMVERLLKTNPQVQQILETETPAVV